MMKEDKNLVLQCIKIEELLEQVNGNEVLIKKLLKSFVDKYNNSKNEIKKFIEEKNFEDAKALIHGIKGVTAKLSIKYLNSSAIDLEKSIKANDMENIKKDFDKFYNRLEEAINEINLYLN